MRRFSGRRAGSVLVLLLAALVAACGGTNPSVAPPTAVATKPPGGVGPATEATRAAIFAALGEAQLIVAESPIPYRPAEAATLAAAPRSVYQVTLPAEPSNGFIVLYELEDAVAATEAAREQHAYLVSGPGRVQYPLGTAHVLQQLGPTVIYYTWLPAASVDPAAPRIAEALRTVGTTFEVTD